MSCFTLVMASSAQAGWHASKAGDYVYKVEDTGTNLSLISLELYGKANQWRKIAEWNGIQAPYLIRIKQKLVLKEAPTLTQEQSDEVLLAYWRRKMGLTGEPAVASYSPPAETRHVETQQAEVTPPTPSAETEQAVAAPSAPPVAPPSEIDLPTAPPAEAQAPVTTSENAAPSTPPETVAVIAPLSVPEMSGSEVPVTPPVVAEKPVPLTHKQVAQLSHAHKEFKKQSFQVAFNQVEKVVQAYDHNNRAPASVEENAAAPQPQSAELRKDLDKMNLAWFEGPAADSVYQAMSRVPETSTQFKSQACSQKKGENLICLRCPASVAEEHESTKCEGFFN